MVPVSNHSRRRSLFILLAVMFMLILFCRQRKERPYSAQGRYCYPLGLWHYAPRVECGRTPSSGLHCSGFFWGRTTSLQVLPNTELVGRNPPRSYSLHPRPGRWRGSRAKRLRERSISDGLRRGIAVRISWTRNTPPHASEVERHTILSLSCFA